MAAPPTPSIDPHRLLVFRAVGRRGSLSGAARELGWTQPAVSQHLKRLERDLGQPLVHRTARGVRLTEAGVALLRHADAVAARLVLAAEEMAALADLRAGRLRFASFPSASATIVPTALALLAERHPQLEVRLTEVEPAAARQLLLQGDVDLALVFTHDDVPEPDDDLVLTALTTDPIRAVLPHDHPLAGAGEVPLELLRDERWVAGCIRCRTHLLACSAAAGFTPDIRHTTDDYVVTQTLVSAGLGIALLPQLALDAARPAHTATVDLRPAQQRRLHLAHVPGAEGIPAVSATVQAVLEVSGTAGAGRSRRAARNGAGRPATEG